MVRTIIKFPEIEILCLVLFISSHICTTLVNLTAAKIFVSYDYYSYFTINGIVKFIPGKNSKKIPSYLRIRWLNIYKAAMLIGWQGNEV